MAKSTPGARLLKVGLSLSLAGTTVLVIPACKEEAPETKSSAPAGTAAPVAAATTEADSGPAANAPALDKDITDPKIEDQPTGKYGDKLVLAAYEDPKTFNITMMTDSVSQRFSTYMFEPLVEEDGMSYEVEPVLASSWTVSDDGKTYLFKLRLGVKWHDGKPVTADDVVFTWSEVMTNQDIPWDVRDTVKIEGKLPVVTKVDDLTVKFTLPRVFSPFLRTSGLIPILPKHVFGPWVKAKGKDGKPLSNSKWGVDTDVTKIVGNGAWQIDSYAPGERIVLKRNPHYFRTNKHKQPLPYCDKIVVPFLKSLETAILKFKAGETDAQWLPGKDFAYMKPQEKQGNFTVFNQGPDFRTTYMAFNYNPRKNRDGKPYVDPIKLKWFANPKWRQAVSYAIDRQAIIKNVFRGLAAEQNSPIFQKSPYYDPTVPDYELNREKAMALLTEEGFKKEGDVLKDKDGHPVEFTQLRDVGFKDGELRANMIAEDLKKIGIKMKFQAVTFNVKLARTHESLDWECISGDWGAGIEPHGLAHLWTSNGESHMFNKNPAMKAHAKPDYAWEKRIDELFEQGSGTVDEAKRKTIYAEFQQLVMKEQVLIFLPVFSYTVAVRNNVGNARPSPFSPLGSSWNSWELYRK